VENKGELSEGYLSFVVSDEQAFSSLKDKIRMRDGFIEEMYRDADIFGTVDFFVMKYKDLVLIVKDIDVFSLCEHHMLPFYGKAHVAYIPNGKIIGLSKIPRVIEVFARRLQVQERLTNQIASALQDGLKPRGVAVVIEALHLCMAMRGVEKQSSTTVTSSMLGGFKNDPRTRQEFLSLIR